MKQSFIVQMTDRYSGAPILVTTDPENIVMDIEASSAMPGFYKECHRYGRTVVDGGINAFQIRRLVKDCEEEGGAPTHIVLVANRSRAQSMRLSGRIGRWLYSTLFLEGALRATFDTHEVKEDDELKYLREDLQKRSGPIPYVIIWTDGYLSTFDVDQLRIKNATATAFYRAVNTLRKYLPEHAGRRGYS